MPINTVFETLVFYFYKIYRGKEIKKNFKKNQFSHLPLRKGGI